MGSDTPSIGHTNSICFELLDSTPISSPLLPTTISYLHAFHESLGDIIGSHLIFEPYCVHLEDVPRKIMWTPFFDHAFDFFMALSKFKKTLTLFNLSLLMVTYSHLAQLHVLRFDKLLLALTAFELKT